MIDEVEKHLRKTLAPFYPMTDEDWAHMRVFSLVLSEARTSKDYTAFVVAVNGTDEDCVFQLPELGEWECLFTSGEATVIAGSAARVSRWRP